MDRKRLYSHEERTAQIGLMRFERFARGYRFLTAYLRHILPMRLSCLFDLQAYGMHHGVGDDIDPVSVTHVLTGAADDFGIAIAPYRPVASWNNGAAFQFFHRVSLLFRSDNYRLQICR